MAAMASMAPLTRSAIAAGPGACRPAPCKLYNSSSTSSLACRAVSQDSSGDNLAEKTKEAVGDVVAAVEQAAIDAVEAVTPGAPATEVQPAAAAASAAATEVQPAAEASVAATEVQPAAAATAAAVPIQSSVAAEWYRMYGRSLAENEAARDVYYGPNRPLWKGPFTQPKDVPEYLKGEVPGDYGCDIFQLARLPKNLERLRTQELMNARWAMLGIVGCLAPELISSSPLPGYQPVWFLAGAQIFSDQGIDYLGVPGFINAHSLFAVLVSNALLMGLSEYARVKFAPEGVDPFYPGGKTFDPLGFGSDPELLAELKVKEIKNGRLAMMAMAGLFAQGAVTGVSPLQNLHDWLKL